MAQPMFFPATPSAKTRFRARLATALALTAAPLFAALPASAQVTVSITIAPPAIPVYDQPPIPDDGYIWTPGYWAWGDDGYYWVPGTWVEPPEVGYLWTPGYWGWSDGIYVWRPGYWGPHVGYYGGINYGWGYGGSGYDGGHWDHDRFSYNRTVNNFGSTHITNVYNKTVIVNNNTRVSYNGGNGGTHARPSPAEAAAAHEHHMAITGEQSRHIEAARHDHSLLASVNHGRPAVLATSRPGVLQPAAATTRHDGATPQVQAQHQRPDAHATPGQHTPGPAPLHHQAQPRQEAPVPHQAPVHHEAPIHHDAPVHHPAPVHHEAPPPRPHPVAHAAPPPHPQEHGPEKKK